MSLPTFQDHLDDHDSLFARIYLLETAARTNHSSLNQWNQALRQLFQRLRAIDPHNPPPYQRALALEAMDVPFLELLRLLEVEFFPSSKVKYYHLVWSRDMHALGVTQVDANGSCTFNLNSVHDEHHNALGVLETFLHEMAHAIPSRYSYYCDCERPSCDNLRWKMDGSTGHAYHFQKLSLTLQVMAGRALSQRLDLGRVQAFVEELAGSGLMPEQKYRRVLFPGTWLWRLWYAIMQHTEGKLLK